MQNQWLSGSSLRVNMHTECIYTEARRCKCGFLPFLKSPNGRTNAVNEWAGLICESFWCYCYSCEKETSGKLESQGRKEHNGPANVIRLRRYSSTFRSSQPIVYSQKVHIYAHMQTQSAISKKNDFSTLNSGGLLKKVAEYLQTSNNHICKILSPEPPTSPHCMLIWKQRLLMIIQEGGNQIKPWRNQTSWQSNAGYSRERNQKAIVRRGQE